MALQVSTKGRYALRVLVDLAEHNTGEFIPLRQIAERQDISEKYLESIIVVFSKSGYVSGHRGKGGGYRLSKDPSDITVAEVLTQVEGDLAPVACLKAGRECKRAAGCKTLPMWKEYYELTKKYFGSITIADLMGDGERDLLTD